MNRPPDPAPQDLPASPQTQSPAVPPGRPHVFDLDRQALADLMVRAGRPPYRADQILTWLYRHDQADPAAMTDLPADDRHWLAEHLTFRAWRPLVVQQASDGTQKLLLGPADHPEDRPDSSGPDLAVECVMIPAEPTASSRARHTACLSCQVGCPVRCTFCASGRGGLTANLTAGQIVEQVHHLNTHLASPAHPARAYPPHRRRRITHVVFMGMGEPLANFDALMGAIGRLTAPWAYHLSARRITVSTVGLPAQIRRLTDRLDRPVTLAISLHAPNDRLRAQLIPWAHRTSIDRILDAGQYYFERTGRELTIEYLLLRHVNDRPQHARQLAELARQLRCNINLIRYNEVAGLPFDRPATEDVLAFQAILRRAGLNVHLRASRGRDIAAACGQLRHEKATGRNL